MVEEEKPAECVGSSSEYVAAVFVLVVRCWGSDKVRVR
jgi:hypothetical protein